MSGRLQQRVAVVTGAAQGIGAAIAQRFVAEGAHVIGLDRKAEGLQQLVAALDAFTPVALDLQDHAAIEQAVGQAIDQHGKIDILINNAGLAYYALMVDTTIEQWRHTQQVNLEAQFVLCRAVAPHMMQRQYGRIVNIASVLARRVEPLQSAYAASKGGVIALTQSLAVELAPYGILANAIAPGVIHTPLSVVDGVDETTTEVFQTWYVGQRKIPLARPGEPHEVASAALFLASEECSYLTGHTLVVDGGLLITF